MIIDSSALIAILEDEPEARPFLRSIALADRRLVPAPILLEACIVMRARRQDGGEVAVDKLVSRLKIEVISFTSEHAETARLAYVRFGRGHHAAKLNYGDCMAYAVAMDLGEPLLFKGEDFEKTDVEKVEWKSCAHKDS